MSNIETHDLLELARICREQSRGMNGRHVAENCGAWLANISYAPVKPNASGLKKAAPSFVVVGARH